MNGRANWFLALVLTALASRSASADFAMPYFVYAGVPVSHVAAGDLNGDGHVDIVCSTPVNFSGDVILLGTGRGAFRPPVVINAGSSDQVAVGDLTGDGVPDIVDLSTSGFGITIHPGHGDGTFGEQYDPTFALLSGSKWRGLALGDVDGDGDIDFVVAGTYNGGDCLGVGFNDGSGHFPPVTGVPTNASWGSPNARTFKLADFDGDGFLDVVMVRRVLFNDGNGNFVTQDPLELDLMSPGSNLRCTDLNQDGIQDVITLSANEHLGGGGTGYFQTVVASQFGSPDRGGAANRCPILPYSAYDPYTTGQFTLADADGDGLVDLELGGGTSLQTFKGLGGSQFSGPIGTVECGYMSELLTTDLNGDGRSDLVFVPQSTPPPTSIGVMLQPGMTLSAPVRSHDGLALSGPTPNPMRSDVRFTFDLPNPGAVRFVICDVTGRVVRSLVDATTSAGRHVVRWDGSTSSGRRVPPGVYLANLATDQGRISRRMLVIR